MRRSLLFLTIAVALCVVSLDAQRARARRVRARPAVVTDAGNPIAADRQVDWTTAGATIATRSTQCGSTVAAYTGTAATINTAITNCTAGQFVQLGAGTFTLSGGILTKDNVTLRGAGPDQTFLVFSNIVSCGGGVNNAYICTKSSNPIDIDAPGFTRTWSAGFAKGSTVLTLSATTSLSVGQIVLLDQLDDTGADTGWFWIGDTPGTHCYDCASPSRGSNRAQQQVVKVTAINGNDITITPPIMWPNFASGKTPQAVYNSGTAATGVGIEDLSVSDADDVAPAESNSITFYNATNSWVKNVRITRCGEKCVKAYFSTHITLRDSYIYDKKGSDASQEGSESYGFDCYMCSSWLVENNIAEHITTAWQCESGVGGVVAYNYTRDDFYTQSAPDWAQASSYNHGVCAYTLYEGNFGFGFMSDIVHSSNYLHTNLRNRYQGWETGSAYTLQTVAIHVYAGNRWMNILGNVLGDDTYHNRYESFPTTATDCDTSIYAIGWGGNCGNGTVANKTDTRTSMFRWGNYDTVNDAIRWVSSEVPTTDANYPNALPSTQTVPNSLYLSAKPAFFKSIPWPPIGPDVTGGNVTGLGGHVNVIPAKACYDAGSFALGGTTFDAADCY